MRGKLKMVCLKKLLNINFNSRLKSDDSGVVGVVVAFLIIGLVMSVIFVVQTVYIPDWMSQREAEHMEKVREQFSRIKYAIDNQVLYGLMQKHNVTASKYKIPVSTSITLGCREFPFLSSSRSFGSINILQDHSDIRITYKNETTGIYDTIASHSIGVIKYSSNNAYFLDQSYIYEAGGVIVDQNNKNAMIINPSIEVEVYGSYVKVTWDVINVKGTEGANQVSGYGTYPVETSFLRIGTEKTDYENVKYVNITTSNRDAWCNYLNTTLQKNGLDYNIDFSINKNLDSVSLKFPPSMTATDVEFSAIDIKGEITSGWVH